MKYFVRRLVPSPGKRAAEVEATGPEDAAQVFLLRYGTSSTQLTLTGPDGCCYHFSRVEVQGHGEMVARVVSAGIWRRGGVRPLNPATPEAVAAQLGLRWPVDLFGAWDGEETWDAARERERHERGGR